MQKKVSVIIPSFNSVFTIEQTINSVLAQTYANLEVIVINDGSIDHTLEVLALFKDKITTYTTANKGVSHARNLGLTYANGEYIQFLDADDLLMPDKIEKQVNALLANDGDIAYGDFEKFMVVNGHNQITETINRKLGEHPEIEIFVDFWCPPAALLYSKKITSQLVWNQNLPIIQDARYMFDAARIGAKFIHTQGIVALYRVTEGSSLSSRSKLAFTRDCFNNAEDIYYHHWSKEILTEEKRKALIKVFAGVLRQLAKNDTHNFEKCCFYLKKLSADHQIYTNPLKRFLCRFIGIKKTEQLTALN